MRFFLSSSTHNCNHSRTSALMASHAAAEKKGLKVSTVSGVRAMRIKSSRVAEGTAFVFFWILNTSDFHPESGIESMALRMCFSTSSRLTDTLASILSQSERTVSSRNSCLLGRL